MKISGVRNMLLLVSKKLSEATRWAPGSEGFAMGDDLRLDQSWRLLVCFVSSSIRCYLLLFPVVGCMPSFVD